MRDYGIVSPRFWIGETGRKLRSMPYAQRVAMYLLTAPASEMTGVYYCPVATILNDVGLPSESLARDHEGALKAVIESLKALRSLDFCEFDFDSEYVFVKEMARWQIAEKLKPTDNRVKGIIKTVESMPEPMRARFIARYNDDFSLGFQVEKQQKSEAPSESLRSQEQEQEQEHTKRKGGSNSSSLARVSETTPPELFDAPVGEADPDLAEVAAPTKRASTKKRGTQIPYDTLPDDWAAEAERIAPDLDARLCFEDFRDYALREGAVYKDWTAAWRNNLRSMPEWKRVNFQKSKSYADLSHRVMRLPKDQRAQIWNEPDEAKQLALLEAFENGQNQL